MSQIDYAYTFKDIGDNLTPVSVFNHHKGKSDHLKIAAKDNSLWYRNNTPRQVADIVDIALAIHIADRLSIPHHNLPCRIHVDLPVREPDLFMQYTEELKNILFWYTDDHWSFKFRPRTKSGRLSERQSKMSVPTGRVTEVALWSGGLDSFAGLWTQLNNQTAEKYILLGAGANNFIGHIQHKTACRVQKACSANIDLVQVPFSSKYINRSLRKKRNQRSRGFVFLLLGAACAYLEGQDTLFVYENGVGALNLPYRESEVGLDHTRAVHPFSLYQMSDFVSHILDIPFHFKNPFLFWTKAQMCASLTHSDAVEIANNTVSCDSLHRKPNQPTQFGKCSSCLLRRQSLAAADIVDRTPYYREILEQPSDRIGFDAMLYQVETLQNCFAASSPWEKLCQRYPCLVTVADRIAKHEKTTPQFVADQIMRLYRAYVSEWDYVLHTSAFTLPKNRKEQEICKLTYSQQ